LDPGVGQAGDARTGTQESTLRIAIGSGVFVVVQKLALGMDERPGLHQLRQETPRGAVRSKSWVFGESQLFECGDFEPLKKGCGVWLSKRSARRGRACQRSSAAGLWLADIGGTRFWRIDPQADYGELNAIVRQRNNIQLIAAHWDDLLRLAGSLKSYTKKTVNL
jgi:hypothetical protein